MTGPAIRELEAPRRNWMIPLILVALALLAIPVLRGLRRPQPPAAARAGRSVTGARCLPGRDAAAAASKTAPAPAPRRRAPPAPVAAEPGTTADMAAFLAGSGETTPHAFAPSPLNFAFGSAKPTPESMKTIDDIAAALKAHPAATIRVESHTDNVGTQESNLNLSQARADSIKSELVDRGVAARESRPRGWARTCRSRPTTRRKAELRTAAARSSLPAGSRGDPIR